MADNGQLLRLRQLVDETDSEIVELLRRRLELVLSMAECKSATGLALRDPNREQAVLRRIETINQQQQPTLPSEKLADIFKTIMNWSLKAQEEKIQSSARNQ